MCFYSIFITETMVHQTGKYRKIPFLCIVVQNEATAVSNRKRRNDENDSGGIQDNQPDNGNSERRKRVRVDPSMGDGKCVFTH